MAKAAYIGVNNTARKVTKIYVGVNNIARKVVKGYVGVNGVARQFWPSGGGSSGRIVPHQGSVTSLASDRYAIGTATIGDYAIFAGGYTTRPVQIVDFYSSSLTRTYGNILQTARSSIAGTTVGAYAIFGGGANNYGTNTYILETFDASLTYQVLSSTLYRTITKAATTGNFAVFAASTDPSTQKTTAVSESLTLTQPWDLQGYFMSGGSASLHGYAIFAGGSYTSYTYNKRCEYYDTQLTLAEAPELSLARSVNSSASSENWVGFFGGTIDAGSGNPPYPVVDVYNRSMVHGTAPSIDSNVQGIGAVGLKDFMIAGGGTNGSSYLTKVYIYDNSLSQSIPSTGFKRGRQGATGGYIGDHALFVGGADNTGRLGTVDVYDYEANP